MSRYRAKSLKPLSNTPLLVVVVGWLLVQTLGVNGQDPVQVIFRGVSLPNNSVLSINDVGEFSNGGAVLCTTDRSPCCRSYLNHFGEWYYPDGTQVPINGDGEDFYRTREDNGTIHLNRRNNATSPTGPFCCELPDSSDVLHRVCVVLVIPVLAPSPPTIVFATPQSITITWSQPEGDVVDSYEILSSYQGPCPGVTQSDVTIAVNDGTTREFTVSDLQEFSVYTITLTAVNINGSIFTGTSVSTLPAVPSGPPQSLTVTSTTPFTISIQWGEMECLEQNSVITGYSVRYGGVTTSVTGASNKTFTASGLTPRTSYTFEVAAVSDSGTGPPVMDTRVTAVPDSVGLLLNGQLYANNSNVTLEEIGEGSAALICLTNEVACCRSSDTTPGIGSIGKWYFPNGSSVISKTTGDSIYRTRGASMVLLHRMNKLNAQTTGVFRCEIPDASGAIQTLYVGVYPATTTQPPTTSSAETQSPMTTIMATEPPMTTTMATEPPMTTIETKRRTTVADMQLPTKITEKSPTGMTTGGSSSIGPIAGTAAVIVILIILLIISGAIIILFYLRLQHSKQDPHTQRPTAGQLEGDDHQYAVLWSNTKGVDNDTTQCEAYGVTEKRGGRNRQQGGDTQQGASATYEEVGVDQRGRERLGVTGGGGSAAITSTPGEYEEIPTREPAATSHSRYAAVQSGGVAATTEHAQCDTTYEQV